jgi:hypothetical protein
VKQVQLSSVTPKSIRDALKSGDDVVLFDGDTPLVRLVSIAAEMKQRQDYFKFYPHPATECFGTCWRHDGHEITAADAATAPAEAELVPVP